MQTAARSDDTTMDGKEALTFVEGLAEKVVGHDYTLSEAEKNAISSIKKFVDRLLKDIVTQREEDQTEVNELKKLIEGCATSATESLKKVAALKTAVGTARNRQSDCRVTEVKAKDAMSAAFAAYDAYAQGPGSNVPACLSSMDSGKMQSGDANTKKSVRSCLEEINQWFPPLWEMYQKCKKKEGIRSDQTDVCNNEQSTFEGGFCQYALLLDTTCDTQDDCRSKNIDARAKGHAAVKIAEKARAADCEVGHKVKCLLAIFEETDNKKKPGMLDSCKSEKYTCPDGITYPEIPGATTCTREPSKPCDDAWLQKEYKSKAWFHKAVTKTCTPCLREPTRPPPPTYTKVGTGHCRDADGGYPAHYRLAYDAAGPLCQQACDLEKLCVAYTASTSYDKVCFLWSDRRTALPAKSGWDAQLGWTAAGGGTSDVDVVRGSDKWEPALTGFCMKKPPPPPPPYIKVGTGHCRDADGGYPAHYRLAYDAAGPLCQQACDLEKLCV